MAKESVYGFQSADVAQKLSAFASQLGGSKSGTTGGGWSTSSFKVAFGEVTTEVTAASGDDLGEGIVKVETWDPNATTVTRSQPQEAQDLEVYNTEESAITVGTPVMVYKVASSLIAFPTSASLNGTGYGALSASLLGTDATASVAIDSTSPIGAGSSVTATNWVGMDGSVGQKCIVAKTAGEWILIQMACSAPSDDDGGSGGGDSGGGGGSGGDSGGGDSGGGGSPGGGTP